jgi:metallo-beta-lactamase class B
MLLAAVALGGLVSHPVSGQERSARLKEAARALVKKQVERSFQAMNGPFEPFRIIGNLYYVGAADVSSFLITTPKGHILIDSGFEATVPLIRDGARKLGFRFEDIKFLLNSHAHLDHAGGHARLKRLTGAQIVMSQADAELLAHGGKGDFAPLGDDVLAYEPAVADRIVRDGDSVSLGGTTLRARLTPGHTKGCTTWTMVVEESGKPYRVVFYGSTTILPGVHLVDNALYPGVAGDFAGTFRVLKSLPCDVFLAPHGVMFDLRGKAKRLTAGRQPNPFVDPEGYRSFVARSEEAYQRQWNRERGASTRTKKDRTPHGND